MIHIPVVLHVPTDIYNVVLGAMERFMSFTIPIFSIRSFIISSETKHYLTVDVSPGSTSSIAIVHEPGIRFRHTPVGIHYMCINLFIDTYGTVADQYVVLL